MKSHQDLVLVLVDLNDVSLSMKLVPSLDPGLVLRSDRIRVNQLDLIDLYHKHCGG